MLINRINKDTKSEIIIRLPIWLRVIAWISLLVIVPILIWGMVMILVGAGNEWYGINAFAFVLFLLGICGVGMTAKLKLNKPAGFMTVESWHVPIFFWLKKMRIVSKEEARSVFVIPLDKPKLMYEWNIWGILVLLLSLGLVPPTRNVIRKYYSIKLLNKSGEEVELLTSSKMDLANYLAKRIIDFSTQSEVTKDIMSTQPPLLSATTGTSTESQDVINTKMTYQMGVMIQRIIGILEIIAGFLIFAEAAIIYFVPGIFTSRPPSIMGVVLAATIAMSVFAAVVLTGGICTLKRGNWVFPFASSIVASLFMPILGFPAIILLTLSRKDWSKKKRGVIIIVLTILIGIILPWLFFYLFVLFLGGL